MKVDLVDVESITGIKRAEQTRYRLVALKLGGVAPALKPLLRMKKKAGPNFRKVVNGLRDGVAEDQKDFTKRKKVEPDRKGRGVYELKSLRDPARVFFFYDEDHPSGPLLILVNSFWKTSDHDKDQKDQTGAFDDAAVLKEEYEGAMRHV